jgi:hypothetical protein
VIAVRPFTRVDWYGYAGAESFEDGTEPRIGELTVDGWDAEIVWDAHGVQVFWHVNDPPSDMDKWLCYEVEPGFAPALLERIERATTEQDLRALGPCTSFDDWDGGGR